MSPAADIQNAMTLAQSRPLPPLRSAPNFAAAKKAAQEFEGVLISQMLSDMFDGVKTDGPFGGGPGEEMFRSLMIDQYGKQIAAQGGLGLSGEITRELLNRQELEPRK
ncbi:MAG TPA: rod-binding protein [Rhizomicrobium sp.]|nr:rod-binding protein [Rhizomicrobium sp.]